MTPEGPTPSGLDNLKIPLYGIFLLLSVQALAWGADFLIPVTASFLGYFVLNRPRRRLQRFGIPPVVSAGLFTIIITILIGFFLVQLSTPAAEILEDLPSLMQELSEAIAASGETMQAINDATEAAGEILDQAEGDTLEVEVVSNSGLASTLVSFAPAFLSRIVLFLVLLFFLVASGDLFSTKVVQSFDNFKDKRKAVTVMRSVEDRLGYYLGGITFINFGLGVTIGLAMTLWGLPSAYLLGIMAFGLNFVPLLGGLFGALIAAALAFLAFSDLWTSFGVFATYVVLTSIEGQFVTPYLISRRMQLNATVVFLAVAFFAWIWSVMGMIVALPILIVLKIVSEETGRMLVLGRFLGSSGPDRTVPK